MLEVRSSAFKAGEMIPRHYTGEGENISPPLEWHNVPERAEELVLICDDPDAPSPQPWVHWVLYNISPERDSLPEGKTSGAIEGQNSWGQAGYGGPMPPQGHGVHHYHFKLYALDQPLKIKASATKGEVLKTIQGHILDQGELVGAYQRE
jgi:Raf kinase inhibitor-like YbhB/YbcL family protein